MNAKAKHKSFTIGILSIVTAMFVGFGVFSAKPTTVKAEDTTTENYLTITGIKGYENVKFGSFESAYTTLKPKFEKLGGLKQEGVTKENFNTFFTNVDKNGDATLTYTIYGTVVYDETNLTNLLTMGRAASHYGSDLHLISFKFIGGNANRASVLSVNSGITLPYEWWSEKKTTSISFDNLTINGSAANGLWPTQSYFERIDFTVNDCNVNGIKIYNCSNVGGSYTIANSTLNGEGTAANAYAIHLQGSETEPLEIAIYNNEISGYDRGINIDQATAQAVIDHNEISIKDETRSCIQITQCSETTVAKNTLNLTGGNAFTLHEKLKDAKVVIDENKITGAGYLFYDNTTDSAAVDLIYGDNNVVTTVDQTQGIYGQTNKAVGEFVTAAIAKNYFAIGDTEYKTFNTALKNVKNNQTIKLIEDFSFNKGRRYAADDQYSSEDDRYSVRFTDFTLDLNGHTLTNPYELESTANYAAIYIDKWSTVTVTDSSEEKTGKMQSGDKDNIGTYLFSVLNGGELVIESGNYFGGGTIAQTEKGTIEVKGGTFDVTSFGGDYDYEYMFNCIDANYKNGTAKLLISGGTFYNYNPANNKAEGNGTNFVSNGYKSVETSTGVFEVVEKSIKQAGVTLGSDIALNFYTTKDGEMSITYRDNEGEEQTVALTKVQEGEKYKFTFAEITPQMIDRNLAVKFFIDGKQDEELEYSVLAYCKAALNADSANESLKTLIGDLLYYGVAAKNYRNMETKTLTAEIAELGLTTRTDAICESKLSSVGTKNVITAATVRLAADNKIIFKIKKADYDANYKFTLDGKDVDFTENGEYYEYKSDGIKALNFDRQLTVVVSEGETNIQTLKISVNDYLADSTDKDIALATYRYGLSAKEYANK